MVANYHVFGRKEAFLQKMCVQYALHVCMRLVVPLRHATLQICSVLVFQMEKYPLLRDQVEKIVVQHGRKGETKSKEQVQFNQGPKIWNSLPITITSLSSFPNFKKKTDKVFSKVIT